MFINKQTKLESIFSKLKNSILTFCATKLVQKIFWDVLLKTIQKRHQNSTNDVWWPNIYQELPNISK
jgi:hypothetical protein